MLKRLSILVVLTTLFPIYTFSQDLKVTDVKKVDANRGKIKADVEFKLNNVFLIKKARVINGKKGEFVAMPSTKYSGEWHDICFPITKEMRAKIEDAILNNKFEPIPLSEQKVNLTEIRINKIKNPNGKVKAFASITLNNSFVIKDIKIIEGSNGLFVGWPSMRNEEGKYSKIIFPVKDNSTIENIILKKYKSQK